LGLEDLAGLAIEIPPADLIEIGRAYKETFGKPLPENPKKSFAPGSGPVFLAYSWLGKLREE